MVDGMNAGAARGGAGVSNYQVDVANAQELAYMLSGGLGEAETGGPTMNVVPRTGGNTFAGSFFFSGANSAMQASNNSRSLLVRCIYSLDHSCSFGRGAQRFAQFVCLCR
jgi:hypothetical protein